MTPNSSLLQWLATFQLDGRPSIELKDDAYYNLADGFVCARILNQISPIYFTDKWLDGIKPVAPNGSWRLRVSNLKRILQKIHDYASDLQNSQFMLGTINPDVTVIAQNFEPGQISRLIQLILFCAINCDRKQDYIEKIRDLPTQVKHDIKEAIEELLVKKNSGNQSTSSSPVRTITAKGDETAQACHDLEVKLKQLQLERDQLLHESEVRRQSVGSHGRDKKDGDEYMISQNKKLHHELQRLKEELVRVETEKEDYRLKSNLLKEDLDKITFKHEELRNKADLAKRLQDELDEHRHITEKVISYEAVVENLVKKNNDLKKEIRNLEEKNLQHIQDSVRLEQENKQLATTVSQMEAYRRQLNETQSKLSQETHRADQLEVELSRVTDRFESTKKENERLYAATNQLIRNSSSSRVLPDETKSNRITSDDVSSISINSIDLKERIARLEMENQLLKEKVTSKSEASKSVLSGLLDESTERCKRLESENQQVRKKLLLLESKLQDMTNDHVNQQPSTSGSNLFQESSSDNVMALIKRVEDLQRLLYQREQELRDAEARYKKNTDKAKEVIRALNNNQSIGSSLHPSCMSSVSYNSSSLDEINSLKILLREKEERLIELEREFLEFRKLKEVHERLILSAFYGLTTPMQWKNAEKRLERNTLTTPASNVSPKLSKHHP